MSFVSFINSTIIKKIKINIIYDNSVQKTTEINIGDEITVTYIRDGILYNNVKGKVTDIVKDNILKIDSSEVQHSNVFYILAPNIREITNDTLPENNVTKNIDPDVSIN